MHNRRRQVHSHGGAGSNPVVAEHFFGSYDFENNSLKNRKLSDNEDHTPTVKAESILDEQKSKLNRALSNEVLPSNNIANVQQI